MLEAINNIKDWTQFNKQWYYYAIAVFICCSLDVISGVFNAFMKETLNSKEFKKGAIGKTAIVSIVGLSMGLDYIFNTHYLYISTCIFYILEESVSILENFGDYIKIPKTIKNKLAELKKKGSEENGK